ncbi:MAG: DUF934 domain-containing protein [Porticoccaceae bacterium]
MPQILKNEQVVSNSWIFLDDSADTVPSGDILLSYEQWQNFADQIKDHQGQIGIWLEGHAEIEEIIEPLLVLPLIAINFPKFADGRGFSSARLIRERYQYAGELRAIGGFIRDQLYLLKRCGFNAFQFSDEHELSDAAESLKDFSENYQVSADQQSPLFRRR